MEILEAVNTVLPQLGEHIVTRVEGSRHPTVDLIVASIDRNRRALLARGWWFNEAKRTLTPNPDGTIAIPVGCISIYGQDCNVEVDGVNLFNLDADSRYFDAPIKVKVFYDKEFERLPYTVAMYITYLTATEVYTQDYGLDNTTQYLANVAQQHYDMMSQENMRKRKYNTSQAGMARIRAKLRR